MTACFFVSDLHGRINRYESLFQSISRESPDAVFLGGDLLPSGLGSLVDIHNAHADFLTEFLIPGFQTLQKKMGAIYPRIFIILGNDDGRYQEMAFRAAEKTGIWQYAHNRKLSLGPFTVYGYSYIPPTPFLLKDWERYDVSRYVDPGCIAPTDGAHTVAVNPDETEFGTIQADLADLTGDDPMDAAIFLFHTPPYETKLDRAALDGRFVDHVPLDVHIGSIAVRQFILDRQPRLTLHGHVHESPRLTGDWKDQLNGTVALSAAHDGPELALVRFDPHDLENVRRDLI